MHDQAAADFGNDLPLRVDASSSRATAADARAAAEKGFVIRKGGEFDVRLFGTRGVCKVDPCRFPGIFDVNEWFFAFAATIVLEQGFANPEVVTEQAHTRVALPGQTEGHHVGK